MVRYVICNTMEIAHQVGFHEVDESDVIALLEANSKELSSKKFMLIDEKPAKIFKKLVKPYHHAH